ncbi:Alpha/Beta hydrolase protein [Rhypophila decipiens]|uniref:Protein phosphatase methylesterase 1 n=1 Tax=Rhypophila decipiens TaxID=261697 RepID=A0AAN7BDV2_9PEZI|nr:Alpha/Beta hydrolase protein [Rhypophila decipiens]
MTATSSSIPEFNEADEDNFISSGHGSNPSSLSSSAIPSPFALGDSPGGLGRGGHLNLNTSTYFPSSHNATTSTTFPISEADDDSSSASSMSSTGTIIPSPGRALFARPVLHSTGSSSGGTGSGGRSYEPIPWTTYFERELWLDTSPTTRHHAYLTSPVAGSGGPNSGSKGRPGPLFVTHHGAGSSGLSFAVVGAEIRRRISGAGILSLDARGHGGTTTTEEQDKTEPAIDLSLSTLAQDLFNVMIETKKVMSWAELPPIILVGHSLGGAVVTELAKTNLVGTSLLGYAVLDVVEGSAMDALQSMQTYLSTRPVGFASLKDGIEWHVRSRTLRNPVSARTSVPGLLVDANSTPASSSSSSEAQQDEQKGVAADGTKPKLGQDDGKKASRPWRWRTNLAATQPFWEDWFVGLSKKFLEAKGGKLLLLAGTDRLDTELTIGQMQGKYALQVFPEAGHFIHEDLPEKTATVLVDFYRRNDRSALVLPPKVSDLLAQGKRV